MSNIYRSLPNAQHVTILYTVILVYIIFDVLLGVLSLGTLFYIATVIHAIINVGYKRAIFFFIVTPACEWINDEIWLGNEETMRKLNLHTYRYVASSDILLHKVPMTLVIGFGAMVYHAFYVSSIIMYEPSQKSKKSKFDLLSIFVAFQKAWVSSFVVTCWALGSERYMLDIKIYEVTNLSVAMFKGVPIGHYVAWAIIPFLFFFPFYLFMSTNFNFITEKSIWMRAISIIVFAGWTIFYIRYYLYVQKDYELVLVLVFTMGFCLLLSITRLAIVTLESKTSVKSDTQKPKIS